MICVRRDCGRNARCRGLCHKHYGQQRRRGRYTYRDAADVLAHLDTVRSLGWTWGQIAGRAGVSIDVPRRLAAGRTRRLRTETADLLLAVPIGPVQSRRGIDNTVGRRRVQALAWMGWPAGEIAARVGVSRATLQTLILPSRRISAALAARITVVYDQLALVPGFSKKVASKARALGFAPPLAWDDESIGDPMGHPAGVAA